jgi:glycosidase
MIPFDSWNKDFKNKFGAVKEGSEIQFRILVEKGANIGDPVMIIEKDGQGVEYLPMYYHCDASESVNWYRAHFKPMEEGLYFYYFFYPTNYGLRYITRISPNAGEYSDSVEKKWQLTVFGEDYETPDWIKGEIIYQIFPDRFYQSEKYNPKDVPKGRILRSDWGSQPHYKPDEENIIRNNDYFCGNIKGIIEKLPYLKELSVGCIYLNPIFEAHSNHRYDTADFEKIDPLLGTEKDLKDLCKKAEKLGIKVILDGVFSHTGADSKYFNKFKRYGDGGAYNDKESPYFNWYKFRHWPNDYTSWWNIDILPEIIEETQSYIDYISGEGGILHKWLNCGVSGYRLDVADELPDVFLDELRKSVKSKKKDALIIGEVWEDASNKTSYGVRRRYLQGKQLDGVMNYPFYGAIVDFVRGDNARHLNNTVMQIMENYPPQSLNVLMNHIGTHDTERILTLIGGESSVGKDREWQAHKSMSVDEREYAVKLLKIASAIQYMLPGVPSIYYGDEAGLEGYRDPFNRACYPWGNEDTDLLNWYKKLGKIRKGSKALKDGSYYSHFAEGDLYIFERKCDEETLICAVNRLNFDIEYKLPFDFNGKDLITNKAIKDGVLQIPAFGVLICKKLEKSKKK